MTFLLQCENKSCKKTTEVVLDKKSNCVHCNDCDSEITNVTSFVKNTLNNMKRYRQPRKSVESFALQCKNCKKKMTPLIIKEDLHCPECRAVHDITSHFKLMFFANIKNKNS